MGGASDEGRSVNPTLEDVAPGRLPDKWTLWNAGRKDRKSVGGGESSPSGAGDRSVLAVAADFAEMWRSAGGGAGSAGTRGRGEKTAHDGGEKEDHHRSKEDDPLFGDMSDEEEELWQEAELIVGASIHPEEATAIKDIGRSLLARGGHGGEERQLKIAERAIELASATEKTWQDFEFMQTGTPENVYFLHVMGVVRKELEAAQGAAAKKSSPKRRGIFFIF